MWMDPLGLVAYFFSREKLRKLSRKHEVAHIREFENTSPTSVKKLYEVVLKKPYL
jgi:CRISPR/Cas system CSM-associated protein Csm2 small subunit